MKKYAILTSVLALAACGGGSGGGGGITGNGTTIGDITGLRTSVTNKSQVINTVSAATATTTKSRMAAPKNTDLDTQYDIAIAKINRAKETLNNLGPNGVTDENLDDVIMALRLAGQTGFGTTVGTVNAFISGDDYSSDDAIAAIDGIISNATQTIEDVNFNVISIEDNGTPDKGILKIKTNGKNIDKITLSYDSAPDSKFTLTPMGGKKFRMVITGGDVDEVADAEIIMLGRGHKLQYADFGYMEQTMVEDGEPEVTREFMTAGYDIMKIDPDKMSGEMTFTGTAVAAMWNDAETLHHNMQDDNATLTFNNGNETLNMHFADWYNVTISNTSGSKSIRFDGMPTDKRFELTTAKNPDNSKLFMETTYYGDGTPSEATASFGYAEGKYNNDYDTTLRGFTGVFGGKK